MHNTYTTIILSSGYGLNEGSCEKLKKYLSIRIEGEINIHCEERLNPYIECDNYALEDYVTQIVQSPELWNELNN